MSEQHKSRRATELHAQWGWERLHKKTTVITVHVPRSLRDQLGDIARKEGMSLSQVVRSILCDAIIADLALNSTKEDKGIFLLGEPALEKYWRHMIQQVVYEMLAEQGLAQDNDERA